MKTASFTTVLLVVLSLGATATAQDLLKPAPLKDIQGSDLLGPDLVDLDGDGKLDIVAGNYAGNFLFFRNVGETTAPKFAKFKKLSAEGKAIELNHW